MTLALRLRDTATRRVGPVRLLEPGVFRMYVCGPTVYDRPHVGHARSYVFYDALKRYVSLSGVAVRHAQNFTDIEESIRLRAEAAGQAPLAYADRQIEHFLADMDALLVRRADFYPRVSQKIPQILDVVERLVDRDAAYDIECVVDQCNVYFDTSKVPDYGALVGTTLAEMSASGTEETGERRQAADFALWKSRDDWGVTWPSRWGAGRPGWHVECVAMLAEAFRLPVDLHGGGLDLVFPHHEGERAIASALWGGTYASHFVHNGFVTIGERKMSKSKGNFVYVADLLAGNEAEAVRAFLLSAPYREPLPYEPGRIEDAARRLAAWRSGAARVRSAPSRPKEARDAASELRTALDDDFDTPRAFLALDRLAAAGSGGSDALAFAAEAFGFPSLAERVRR